MYFSLKGTKPDPCLGQKMYKMRLGTDCCARKAKMLSKANNGDTQNNKQTKNPMS